MPYRPEPDEYAFLLSHVVGFDQVTSTPKFAEAGDVWPAILEEAAKLGAEVLSPLNRAGDLHPARLEGGRVVCSPGFADGYRALAEGGWIGLAAAPEYDGMGLPVTLMTVVNDMFAGANMALTLGPLLAQGQIEALEAHASPEMQALYLPKIISGEWAATMNLTEPQAGSDLAALSAKAADNGDGSYAVSGQKIFISWGDNDFLPNVIHLVLARLPDAPAGSKGISLFLVPKVLVGADGSLGAENSLRAVGVEHKMGLHGSPTCVMEFDGAKGWLVGQPHKGLAAMFTMMNNARLAVGAQGTGVAGAALAAAVEFAMGRRQGKSPLGDSGTGAIIDHADVRQMLTAMKADLFAARAIALSCGVALDLAKATGDPLEAARAGLLTPIAKAFGTDVGHEVAQMAIQVHGGMGYVEETGVAQFARDVRVTAIYEGTNGIQAMDLVGRKMMDGGDAALRLLAEIEAGARAARLALPELASATWEAGQTLREAIDWLREADPQDRFAGAVPFLRGFARVLGAHYHLRAAMAVGGKGPRHALAAAYIQRRLPEHACLFEAARAGAAGLYDLTPEDLGA